MAEIINIKNEAGEVQYPVTKPECVIDENGKSVLTLIQENGTELRQEIDELSERINNLPQGDEFDKEGNYPLLHVGTADTAIDLAGRGESVPASFGFRASGGKSIKDGRAYIKRIKGNSVVWNQKLIRDNQTTLGITTTWVDNIATLSGIATSTYAEIQGSRVPIFNGHKYLVEGWVVSNPNGLSFGLGLFNNIQGLLQFDSSTVYKAGVFICNGYFRSGFGVNRFGGAGTDLTGLQLKARVIDLTQMFQAGNEPTTTEEFYARVATLGVDLNAYNEGQVIHCNTESIKSVGDNAWDEEWKRGYYMGKEYISVATNQICSANPIPCLPNEAYCVSVTGKTSFPNTIKFTFLDAQGDSIGEVKITNTDQKITTPINATSFLVSFGVDYGDTYKNDILISLYHSGWKAQKDDQYQPYWQDILPLPIISKYFPDGMKSAGTAHDEIRFNKQSGKWEYSKGKMKEVDMGSMVWSYFEGYGFYATAPNNMVVGNLNYLTNQSYSKYANPDRISWTNSDKAITNGLPTIGTSWVKNICVKDSAYTDVESFKAAMAGVILYYESNDWEWKELDEADQNFRDYYNVADFGTEMSQSSVPSANFSADIIYQFNAVDMIREHELEITELQNVIATMQAQLASLTSNNE